MIYYRISGDLMINMLSSTTITYEESAGSEINPLNMLLAIVYIVVVMALIYVILLCIDRFAKKNKNNGTTFEKKANEENSGDEGKDE